MNLLDLIVKIRAQDEASSQIEGISTGIIAKGTALGNIMSNVATQAFDSIVQLGQQIYDSYASYEQLAGGVEKLYGEAADAVKEYAQKAYMTAGMSANQYMEQATSFSAALIQSLDGDVQKAAEQTDVAMRAMSDNVNVFGTDMESVQNAFQGFAKQNYTMLDNLKLGYGGTKEEMERLIADANEYAAANGKAADLTIESFSDIVTAIDLIQEKQGIAGATQDEAMHTLEGSANAAAAAWENLLAELGKDDADISARIDELMDSLGAYMSNVGELIGKIVEHIPDMLSAFLEGMADMIKGFAEHTDEFVEAAGDFIMGIGTAIVEHGPELLLALGELLVNLVVSIGTHIGDMIVAGAELIGGLVDGLWQGVTGIATAISDMLWDAVDAIGRWWYNFFQAGANLIQGLIDGFLSGVSSFLSAVSGTVAQADGTVQYIGQIYSPSKLMKKRGVQLIQGLALGITDSMGLVTDAMSEVSSALAVDMDIDGRMSSRARAMRSREQVYAPRISVNVQARTDADPEEIAYASARRVKQILAARGC